MSKSRDSERRDLGPLAAGVAAVALLTCAVLLVWVVRHKLEIESDAVLTALLIFPVVVYLVLRDRIEGFKGFGIEARLSAQLERTGRKVTEELQIQPERAHFLGKLQQLLEKEKEEEGFCLLYADIDGLRTITRSIYVEEMRAGAARRLESVIRREIISCLAYALSDAFYAEWASAVGGRQERYKGAKIDVYLLEEPDIAIIIRGMALDEVREIAGKGLEAFPAVAKAKTGRDEHFRATVATLSTRGRHGRSAGAVDEEAAARLRDYKADKTVRGKVR